MKVVILHKDVSPSSMKCLSYFIEKGKGFNKRITLYDYTYYRTSNRIQINTFTLLSFEVDIFKQHFSIYN